MSDRHTKTPYPLRMDDDLRAKLEKEAAAGNRSLHAEIVARLQSSFEPQWPETRPPADDGHLVYLLLDTNGYPISWDEIRALYDPLIKGQPVQSLQATVITPDVVSSSDRDTKVVELAAMLRKGGKSRVIRKGQLINTGAEMTRKKPGA